MSNVQWFYADAQQQQQGPLTFEKIQQLAAEGTILPDTLIWNKDMPNWTAAKEVPHVLQIPGKAPPLTPPTQSNPYAAPLTGNPMGNAMAGTYPIPRVKKASFGLFLTTFLVGLGLIVGGFGIFIAQVVETISEFYVEIEEQRGNPLETREDAAKWEADQEEAMRRKLETEFTNNPPTSVIICFVGGFAVIGLAWIIGCTILNKAWQIVQAGGARTTPSAGAWLMLIPLFNLYWMFVAVSGWAEDWNRIRASNGNLTSIPPVSKGLFLTTLIMFLLFFGAIFIPVLNLIFMIAVPILIIIVVAQICRTVNRVAALSQGH